MSLLLHRKLRLYSSKVLDGDQLLGFLAFNLSTNGILHKQNFYPKYQIISHQMTTNLLGKIHPDLSHEVCKKKRNRPIPPSLQNADRSFSRELPALSYFLSAACARTANVDPSRSIIVSFQDPIGEQSIASTTSQS